MDCRKSIKATVMKFKYMYVMYTDMRLMPFVFRDLYCEDYRKRSHFIAFYWVFLLNTQKCVFPFLCFIEEISERSSEDFEKRSNSKFFAKLSGFE